jgi:tRNA nucleotidyltransferase/poly(A) polymerase
MENKFFDLFEVGGKIRDLLLNLPNKDVDYVAVPSKELLEKYSTAPEMFNVLKEYLEKEKYSIFLVTPGCYTIRAKFPDGHKYQGVADFVMARKEIGYIPGTRTPIVVPGTLYEDLLRRDFCCNALAKGDDGEIIDYFGGIEDIKNKILRTPLDCKITFDDDPLRICRGIRFSITKGFALTPEVEHEIKHYNYYMKMKVVSEARIREELYKCFKFDSLKTIKLLNKFSRLRNYIFNNTELWLKPTNEK